MTGRVFEIREFCLHDGPGPRTTVFLQGCPLRCRWCQNPEGLPLAGGTERSAAEVVDEIARTADFLLASGGGVTFSGGEPLVQSAFVLEIVRLLRERFPAMTFALETSGFAEADVYRRVVSEMTVVLQDLKLPDAEGYRKWTGVDAAPIFRNLEALKTGGVRHVIRIPTMPGVNDTPASKRAFAALLAGDTALDRVELLPYNRLAGSKYAKLGVVYAPGFDEAATPDLSTDVFTAAGLPALAL